MNKEEAIKECGKHVALESNKCGVLVARKMYCGYAECPNCHDYEFYVRRKRNSELAESSTKLYRVVTDESYWRKIARKLTGVNYIKIPLPNNSFLLYTDCAPQIKGIEFSVASKRSAITELNREEYCFVDITDETGKQRRRSSSKNWRLTVDRIEYSETIEVTEYVPAFTPQKDSGLLTPKITNLMGLLASTWNRGEVTKDNLQDFVNHRTNKYIDIALEFGFAWNKSMSRKKKRIYGVEEIEKWSVSSQDVIQDVYGDNAVETFSGRLYGLITGTLEPVDYVSEMEERDALNDMIQKYEEYGPVVFAAFYGKEIRETVESYLNSQTSDEQDTLNKMLPF